MICVETCVTDKETNVSVSLEDQCTAGKLSLCSRVHGGYLFTRF